MAYDKVVDSSVLDGYFDDIADAIRAKGGSGTYTPAQMPQAIADIPEGNPALDALLAGTATGNITIAGVEDWSFGRILLHRYSDANNVTELHLPDLLYWRTASAGTLGARQNYGGCIDATRQSQKASSASLQVLDIPKCIRLHIAPPDNSVSYVVFGNMTTLNAPKLQSLSGCLRECGLSVVDLPELVEMLDENKTFYQCVNLKTVKLPKLNTGYLNNNTFSNCRALESLDIGKIPSIGDVAKDCSSLVAVVLRGSSVTNMTTTTSFNNTPIASGTGYIYVPRALISSYEAATNWSAYAGQFRALEDYTDDHTVDGEFILPAN